MARNTTVVCAARTWTQVTTNDATAIRLCNLGSLALWVQASSSATPASTNGAIPLLPNEVIVADLLLTELFPGVANPVRVFVYAEEATRVSVSHA